MGREREMEGGGEREERKHNEKEKEYVYAGVHSVCVSIFYNIANGLQLHDNVNELKALFKIVNIIYSYV